MDKKRSMRKSQLSVFLDYLREKSILSNDQVRVVLQEYEQEQKSLSQILLDYGFVRQKELLDAYRHSGFSLCTYTNLLEKSHFITHLPHFNVLIDQKVIPFHQEGLCLHVAMVDVLDVRVKDMVRRTFEGVEEVIPYILLEEDLKKIINTYGKKDKTSLGYQSACEKSERKTLKELREAEEVEDINHFIQNFLEQAFFSGASDIHLTPSMANFTISFRIDGLLEEYRILSKKYWPALCVRLKMMADINLGINRLPQQGRFLYPMGHKQLDFRVAVHPIIHGENIVIRLLENDKISLHLTQLGLFDDQQALLHDLLTKPEGLIMVAGPTGVGKTTTIFALLYHLKEQGLNTMTLEEPVEYRLNGIKQSSINEGAGFNFEIGIRSILRQDPEVIFIGEVRDEKAASMALRAAMTGHRVFTTLHTKDVFGVVYRLMDLHVNRYLLAGHVTGILSQRLVRVLCPSCRMESPISAREKEILDRHGYSTTHVYVASGCLECQGRGYKARRGIFEILPIDERIDDWLASNQPRSKLRQYAVENGFDCLEKNALRNVVKGYTSFEEIKRALFIQ